MSTSRLFVLCAIVLAFALCVVSVKGNDTDQKVQHVWDYLFGGEEPQKEISKTSVGKTNLTIVENEKEIYPHVDSETWNNFGDQLLPKFVHLSQERLQEIAKKLLTREELAEIDHLKKLEFAQDVKGFSVAQIIKAIAKSRNLRKKEAAALLSHAASKAAHEYYVGHHDELGSVENWSINHTVNGVLDRLVSDASVRFQEVKVALNVIDDFSRFLAHLEYVHSKKKSIRRLIFYFSKLRLYVKLRSGKSIQRTMKCIVDLSRWIDPVLIKVVEKINFYIIKALETPSEPIDKARACKVIKRQIRAIIQRLKAQIAKANPTQKQSLLVAIKELKSLISIIAQPGASFLGALAASKSALKGVGFNTGVMGALKDLEAAKEFLDQADKQLLEANTQLLKDIEQFQKSVGQEDPQDDRNSVAAAIDDLYNDISRKEGKVSTSKLSTFRKSLKNIIKLKRCVKHPQRKVCRRRIRQVKKDIRKLKLRSKNTKRINRLFKRLSKADKRSKLLKIKVNFILKKFKRQFKKLPKSHKKMTKRLVQRLKKVSKHIKNANLRSVRNFLRNLRQYIRKMNRRLRGKRLRLRLSRLVKLFKERKRSVKKDKKKSKKVAKVVKILKGMRRAARNMKLRTLRHSAKKLVRKFTKLDKFNGLESATQKINKLLQSLEKLIQTRKARRLERKKKIVKRWKKFIKKVKKTLKRLRKASNFDKVKKLVVKILHYGRQQRPKKMKKHMDLLSTLASKDSEIRDDISRLLSAMKRRQKRMDKLRSKKMKRMAKRCKSNRKNQRKLRHKMRRGMKKLLKKLKKTSKKSKDVTVKKDMNTIRDSLRKLRRYVRKSKTDRKYVSKMVEVIQVLKSLMTKHKLMKHYLKFLKRMKRMHKRELRNKKCNRLNNKLPSKLKKALQRKAKDKKKQIKKKKHAKGKKLRNALKKTLNKDKKKFKKFVKKSWGKFKKFMKLIRKLRIRKLAKKLLKRIKRARRHEKKLRPDQLKKDVEILNNLLAQVDDSAVKAAVQKIIANIQAAISKVEKVLVDKYSVKKNEDHHCHPKPKPKIVPKCVDEIHAGAKKHETTGEKAVLKKNLNKCKKLFKKIVLKKCKKHDKKNGEKDGKKHHHKHHHGKKDGKEHHKKHGKKHHHKHHHEHHHKKHGKNHDKKHHKHHDKKDGEKSKKSKKCKKALKKFRKSEEGKKCAAAFKFYLKKCKTCKDGKDKNGKKCKPCKHDKKSFLSKLKKLWRKGKKSLKNVLDKLKKKKHHHHHEKHHHKHHHKHPAPQPAAPVAPQPATPVAPQPAAPAQAVVDPLAALSNNPTLKSNPEISALIQQLKKDKEVQEQMRNQLKQLMK